MTPIAAEIIRHMLISGRKIVFTVPDQRSKIPELLEYFPGALISVVGDRHLEVHLRKQKRVKPGEGSDL